MHTNPAPVDFHEHEGIAIMRFEASHIDQDVVDRASKLMFDKIDAHHPPRVVLNLRKVDYLHSLGLGMLAGLSKHIQAYGGKLRLCSLQPEVLELLTVTHMLAVFECYDTEPSALQDFV